MGTHESHPSWHSLLVARLLTTPYSASSPIYGSILILITLGILVRLTCILPASLVPRFTQPWANASTYAQLYEQASDSERLIAFSFVTPTAFRQREYDSVPLPECVFNSLLKRWNKYSGIEISHIPIESIFLVLSTSARPSLLTPVSSSVF